MFGAVGTATEWEGTAAMPLSFGRKLTINLSTYQSFVRKGLFLYKIDCWSAIPVRTQSVMQLLRGTWQSHVSL